MIPLTTKQLSTLGELHRHGCRVEFVGVDDGGKGFPVVRVTDARRTVMYAVAASGGGVDPEAPIDPDVPADLSTVDARALNLTET